MDIEELEEMSVSNPVFASGVDFFYKLGGINDVIYKLEEMKSCVTNHIEAIRALKMNGKFNDLGPKGRGSLGVIRNGRKFRAEAMHEIKQEYMNVIERYMTA